ncbi:hypothetical protein [Hymenobacter algoricola]|uniref:XRE family transcriptional regulator n=1 Tax=Hymenobacter algoricola TaxID=486267 RepID=A0ABP7MZ68_9BACT
MKNPHKLAGTPDLLPTVRAYFGLTQAELACLLGVPQPRLAQAETDARPLSTDAYYRLRALRPLLALPEPAPTLTPTDVAALQVRLAAARDQARRLRYRLAHDVPARAAPAARRLAVAEALPAALAATEPDAPLPPRTLENQYWQWRLLVNKAIDELESRSGPGPAAQLRARLAGLEAEAAALAQTLAEAGAAES